MNRMPPDSSAVAAGAYSFGSPSAATRRAIVGSWAYSRSPGQVVSPVSRCPEIARRKTGMPLTKRSFPDEIALKVESGSTCARSRRHASVCTSASTAAGGGSTERKSPITAMPNEPVLNPLACAPTTFRSMPPYRPS